MTSLAGVDMDLLANDLSIHRQFRDISSFRNAIAQLMAMRNAARRFGRGLYCHQAFLNVEAMPGVPIQQALGSLNSEERRAVMVWLTRYGPFWDDLLKHGSDDWLECRNEIVTDSAVGEAAFRTLHGVECGLVSVTPSDWDYSPVTVTWRRESGGDPHTDLDNWRNIVTLEEVLRDSAPPVRSWGDLREASTNRFESLIFAEDCFNPLLEGVPFAKSSAGRILVLLGILDRFARSLRRGRCAYAQGPTDLPRLLHRRQRIVLRFLGHGEDQIPQTVNVSPSKRSRKGFVLFVARQGAPRDVVACTSPGPLKPASSFTSYTPAQRSPSGKTTTITAECDKCLIPA